jgi:hypothetical protein
MSTGRARRNGGRVLALAFISADVQSRKALQALSDVTKETFRSRNFDVSRWPTDVKTLLAGVGAISRVARIDAFGDEHVFVRTDCGSFDLLVGVSSRRQINVPGIRTGNIATNVLLDVLALPDSADPTRPLYGELGMEALDRAWRNKVGAAHLQDHAHNWDLVLWSRSDRLDFAVPGTDLIGTIRGSQAAEQATALVVNSCKHKSTAHREGTLKYAKGQTHPIIRVHPVTRKIIGYNEDVVGALRDAVRLLRNGASWDEAAQAVGGRIPAPQAQSEPDDDVDGTRTRTRAGRNQIRVAQGLPALPLKFLPDGSPNPEYQPETILDLKRPGERLQALLIRGISVPERHKDTILNHVDDDLGGIAPEDSFHHLYATGVYMRLVKDQEMSNSSISRFRWEKLDLGLTADGQFVLTHEDIDYLRRFRTGAVGTGSWGTNPLTGVFNVAQPEPLYTRTGWLDPTNGTFRVRSGSNNGTSGLRVWFEPFGAAPHSNGCRAIGWIPNTTLGPLLSQIIIDAVSTDHELGSFQFEHVAVRRNEQLVRQQVVEELERRHGAAAMRLTDPDLSDMTLAALKRQLASIELELTEAHTALEQANSDTESGQRTYGGNFDISDLAQLCAILEAAIQVPPQVSERASRLLRTLVPDCRLTLEPATATIRIDATLMLTNQHGSLGIPLRARVDNQSSDPWVAGLAGMWWDQRTVPFADLMVKRGLTTNPSHAKRWHQPVITRLLEEAAVNGHPIRGANLASFLVRCNDPTTLGRVRTALDTGEMTEELRAFLHDGPDMPKGSRWGSPADTFPHEPPPLGP